MSREPRMERQHDTPTTARIFVSFGSGGGLVVAVSRRISSSAMTDTARPAYNYVERQRTEAS